MSRQVARRDGAEILRFRRSNSGWDNIERAELHGVLRFLLSAGQPAELEEGLSDEGEPWGAFCDGHTGDVKIHIARIDGRYVIHAVALREPVQGRSIRDCVNRYLEIVGQARVPVPPSGPNVYIHPSAMMMALFLALFIQGRIQDEAWPQDQGAPAPDRATAGIGVGVAKLYAVSTAVWHHIEVVLRPRDGGAPPTAAVVAANSAASVALSGAVALVISMIDARMDFIALTAAMVAHDDETGFPAASTSPGAVTVSPYPVTEVVQFVPDSHAMAASADDGRGEVALSAQSLDDVLALASADDDEAAEAKAVLCLGAEAAPAAPLSATPALEAPIHASDRAETDALEAAKVLGEGGIALIAAVVFESFRASETSQAWLMLDMLLRLIDAAATRLTAAGTAVSVSHIVPTPSPNPAEDIALLFAATMDPEIEANAAVSPTPVATTDEAPGGASGPQTAPFAAGDDTLVFAPASAPSADAPEAPSLLRLFLERVDRFVLQSDGQFLTLIDADAFYGSTRGPQFTRTVDFDDGSAIAVTGFLADFGWGLDLSPFF